MGRDGQLVCLDDGLDLSPAGVAAWIRRRRLECCRRDLLDPALRAQPVSAMQVPVGSTTTGVRSITA